MKKILPLLVMLCFTMPQFAHAGAWTVPQYSIWAQETLKANWARTEFGPGPDRNRGSFSQDARAWGWSMIPEANIGITDWCNFLIAMDYKEQKYKEYARPNAWGAYSVKNHGLVSITPGLKVRLLEKPVVLSAQIKYEIYNDYDQNDYISDIPFNSMAGQPGISDRTNALELRGLIGKKWDTKIPFYLGAESGYRWNSRNLQNQVPFFVEGGFWPLKWLLIKTEIDGYWSVDGKRELEKAYAIWRAGPEIQLLDLWDELRGKKVTEREVTASVTKKGRSFNVGVQYGNTFWGQSTAASQEVILKISGQY